MALPAETFDTDPWVPEDTFSSRLALVRNHLHWNVKEAADACGINDQTWRNWEEGSLPRDITATARKIAAATGCDARWLILGGQKFSMMMRPDLRLVPDPVEPLQCELFDTP